MYTRRGGGVILKKKAKIQEILALRPLVVQHPLKVVVYTTSDGTDIRIREIRPKFPNPNPSRIRGENTRIRILILKRKVFCIVNFSH